MRSPLFLLAVALALTACGGPKDPNLGLWGGKLNDEFPVFITVDAGNSPGTYRVGSAWTTTADATEYREARDAAKKVESHVEARFFFFKVNGRTGMIYGFNPAMAANLVKLGGDEVPLFKDGEQALRKAGWKPGAPPPEEAMKQIAAP
jgi:hypothetical protein